MGFHGRQSGNSVCNSATSSDVESMPVCRMEKAGIRHENFPASGGPLQAAIDSAANVLWRAPPHKS